MFSLDFQNMSNANPIISPFQSTERPVQYVKGLASLRRGQAAPLGSENALADKHRGGVKLPRTYLQPQPPPGQVHL